MTAPMTASSVPALQLLEHVGTGFGLSYALGFERQLRGSVAGNRTFALVGTSAAAITAVAHTSSPQAIAGIVTGIGFIGAGVVFRGRTGSLHGVTTAATILAAAAIGIVVGYGYQLAALIVTFALLVVLEIPHIPPLRFIDARTYMRWVKLDPDLVNLDPPAQSGPPAGPAPGGDARPMAKI
jgi:putative Mg2+ transporter-C (MgtC) family protein